MEKQKQRKEKEVKRQRQRGGAGVAMERDGGIVHPLPFEQLPNLPKPVIPAIDLGIGRIDVSAFEAPPLAHQRHMGFFVTDNSSQTDQSDIMDVKRVTHTVEVLVQDLAKLRRDLNFSQHVLKSNYERKLNEKATELYCRVNEKIADLETSHSKKTDIVRHSYHQQLANAVQKIAGEYKAYYDELLSGRTGRHDIKIKELKQIVAEQEALIMEQGKRIEELTANISEGKSKVEDIEDIPLPAPPDISLEEAEQLRATIEELEVELTEARQCFASLEEVNRGTTRELDIANKNLEEEKQKVVQLKRDMDGFKKKTKAEQQTAARLAETQKISLEKQMKEKTEQVKMEAAEKIQREAELQRMKDKAVFVQENERRRKREEEMQAQLSQQSASVSTDGELQDEVARLQQVKAQQTEDIQRLQIELDRANKVWTTKLTTMQKNFHALRNEIFLRGKLRRQAATLHNATVGYTLGGHGHTSTAIVNSQMEQDKQSPYIENSSPRDEERSSPLAR